MATSFEKTIKPYFSACYRDHMTFMFDLWSAADVQASWDDIAGAVEDGSMPQAGCPEGVWTPGQAQQFLTSFRAWKNDGFPP